MTEKQDPPGKLERAEEDLEDAGRAVQDEANEIVAGITPDTHPKAFRPPGPASRSNLADSLRSETVGGVLMLAATVIALLWVNLPIGDSYVALKDFKLGPSQPIHLDLSVSEWAQDGLLAIFFFVTGLELKREFVAGDLRDPKRAVLPMVAAVGGMAAPALIYVGINLFSADGALKGWAVPTATDIAFAVCVLAIVGKKLPLALRTFLLTLAVVDDLLAILIIAIFYADSFKFLWLLGSILTVAVVWILLHRGFTRWFVLIPLALIAWICMHESGVHATIAGVLLGFAVPALVKRKDGTIDEDATSIATHFEHLWRPISAGVAVPVFALFAAGVPFTGETMSGAFTDPAAIGVFFGLLFGKPIGITLAAFLTVKFTKAELGRGVNWVDIFGIAIIGGIGFTVSLLVGELAFGEGSARDDHIRAAILAGSFAAALIGGIYLALRGRRHAEGKVSADQ